MSEFMFFISDKRCEEFAFWYAPKYFICVKTPYRHLIQLADQYPPHSYGILVYQNNQVVPTHARGASCSTTDMEHMVV